MGQSILYAHIIVLITDWLFCYGLIYSMILSQLCISHSIKCMMNWEGCRRKWEWCILRSYFHISLAEMWKSILKKNSTQSQNFIYNCVCVCVLKFIITETDSLPHEALGKTYSSAWTEGPTITIHFCLGIMPFPLFLLTGYSFSNKTICP